MVGPPFAHGVTIEIWRAESSTDEYGNQVPGSFARHDTIAGCGIAPRREDELVDNGRMGVIVGWTLYVPYGVDVQAHDRVRYLGQDFTVEGEPGVWEQPMSGWAAGVEINIRKVEG